MKLESLIDPYRPKSRCHPIEETTASSSFWDTLGWAFKRRSLTPLTEWRSARRNGLELRAKLIRMLTDDNMKGYNPNLDRALRHMRDSGLGKIPLSYRACGRIYQQACFLYLTTPIEHSAFETLVARLARKADKDKLLTPDQS